MKTTKIINRKIIVTKEKQPFLDKMGDNNCITCEDINREIKMKHGKKV